MSKASNVFARWFFNLMRGIRWVGSAIIGKPVPKYALTIADRKYFCPPQGIIDKAVEILAEYKVNAGFIRSRYAKERWDCDNASLFDHNALRNDILPALCANFPAAEGSDFRVGEWSFMRSDNGKRHRVAFIENNEGVRTYIETYSINGSIIRILDEAEEVAGYEVG